MESLHRNRTVRQWPSHGLCNWNPRVSRLSLAFLLLLQGNVIFVPKIHPRTKRLEIKSRLYSLAVVGLSGPLPTLTATPPSFLQHGCVSGNSAFSLCVLLHTTPLTTQSLSWEQLFPSFFFVLNYIICLVCMRRVCVPEPQHVGGCQRTWENLLFLSHVELTDYLGFWLDSKTLYLLKLLTGFRNTFF